jgi:ribonuclease HI
MAGGSNATAKASKENKFYAVAVGHVPGVYTDYASVVAQTKNCPGAKQKAFTTREEAQAYVNDARRDASAPISLRGDVSEASSLVASKGSKASDNPPKKQKKNDILAQTLTNGDIKWELGMGPLPEDAEDGFDPTIKLDTDTGNIRTKTEEELSRTKLQPTGDFSGVINVYTDGSSLGNGKLGAIGGVGVYFGPNDSRFVCSVLSICMANGNRNISEPLRGGRQTNQRAELTAVARALDHVPIDRSVLIHTDSNYAIKCLTEWFQKWETNNWKSSSGKDVENKDLVEPIIARIREREMCRAKTEFKWIKGHSNDPGNCAADLLAVQGSRNSTPDLRNADIRTISDTLNSLTKTDYKHSSHKSAMAATNSNTARLSNGVPAPDAQEAVLGDNDGTDNLAQEVDDGADYERIFAALAEENQGHSSGAVNHAAVADAWDGHDQLNAAVNGDGSDSKIKSADSMDTTQRKLKETF